MVQCRELSVREKGGVVPSFEPCARITMTDNGNERTLGKRRGRGVRNMRGAERLGVPVGIENAHNRPHSRNITQANERKE